MRPGLRRGATIRLGAWVREGSRQFVFLKGRDDSFGRMASRRGATPPKDATIHDGDLCSPYKRTSVHNQGR